jgi:hypothetical protein
MNEFLYNPPSKVESVLVNGIELRKGDRVRIRPRALADALDIALAGRTALIESIESDVDNKIQLALVVEDDPGLGPDRTPGHRFFYAADEVEPLEGE